MTAADLHMLAGAYALGALDASERDAFEQHLAQCEACSTEVREFLATSARLALAVEVTPPPELRQRVLGRVAQTRQEPPRVETLPGQRRTRGSSLSRASRFALAASVAIGLSLGGVAVWQYQRAEDAHRQAQQAQQAEAQARQIAAVLSAPDAKTVSGTLAGGVTASVVESPSVGRAVFHTSGLPALADGKVYQLWYDDAGTMRPAGLVTPAAPDQTVLLAGQVGNAAGMGITVEPAGGSLHPTSAPIALMRFPAA
ncbi:anti-sigma factor [Streptacidiphilus rugosus]|uniref:anti-sigma factor n=1 Tax=Streptacidiphilus rugosus TaxID=405783 RepID=UPI00055D90B0|nr:anti-sigma factor [Streptacidiphilus rugosus]